MNRIVSAFHPSKTNDVPNKLALVTGATDGIGLTTAKNLAKKGYQVIVHGRDSKRIESACQQVNQFASSSSYNNHKNMAIPALADLSSLSGCHQLISILDKIHIQTSYFPNLIIHNAGVFSDELIHVGEQKLEQTFAVNVLAPFVLTSMLLPNLLSRDKEDDEEEVIRIVVASSISQSSSISNWEDVAFYEQERFSSHKTYSESKLLVAMLTYEMSQRLQSSKLNKEKKNTTMNCLDPGTVNTKMLLAGWGYCGIDVDRALDETWLSTTESLKGMTGKYYVGRSERKSSSFAYDRTQRKKLWDLLCDLAPDAALQWDE